VNKDEAIKEAKSSGSPQMYKEGNDFGLVFPCGCIRSNSFVDGDLTEGVWLAECENKCQRTALISFDYKKFLQEYLDLFRNSPMQ